MKHLLLQRGTQTRTECEGVLSLPDVQLMTMERTWIPTMPGGEPYESCVPAGTYKLLPHTRANGDRVFVLVNPGLAVYYMQEDRPARVGRFLIQMHKANWARELKGCIAPGLSRRDSTTGPMVVDSAKAMALIMEYVGDDEAEIEIVGQNSYATEEAA